MIALCLVLSSQAQAAEFYLASDTLCTEEVFELPLNQESVLELCLENTSPYTRIMGFAFGVDVTVDIWITDWVNGNGTTAAPIDPVTRLTGANGTIVPEGIEGPVHVGTLTFDVGPGGGEVYADSNGQLVSEWPVVGSSQNDVPSTLVPEPASLILQVCMLLSLSALAVLRRS